MDTALVNRIARSVLYEGYLLYPYRPSSLKNAKRWTFGTLYPETWVAAHGGSDRSRFRAEVLYIGPPAATVSIFARFLAEDVETEIPLEAAIDQARRQAFLNGEIVFEPTPIAAGIYKLNIELGNTSEAAELASAHAVISVSEGELVSMTDPPPEMAGAVSQCVNEGVWPDRKSVV